MSDIMALVLQFFEREGLRDVEDYETLVSAKAVDNTILAIKQAIDQGLIDVDEYDEDAVVTLIHNYVNRMTDAYVAYATAVLVARGEVVPMLADRDGNWTFISKDTYQAATDEEWVLPELPKEVND
jgi:hypothetical protein